MNSTQFNHKISIITVTYNAAAVLEATILSVINQTYPNIEYIIIDGGSSDKTVDIIKKYENKIGYWISEPDKGIYDAMNKGIDKATGEWLNFMNAGDSFFNNNVIEDIVEILQNFDGGVIYGDVIHQMPYGNKLLKSLPINSIVSNMPCSHQAMFVKSVLHKLYPFDLKYRIVADYNFFYNLYKNGYSFKQVSICIANSEGTGESYKNKILMMKEILLVRGDYNKLSCRLCYMVRVLELKVKHFAKVLVPDPVTYKIAQYLKKYN